VSRDCNSVGKGALPRDAKRASCERLLESLLNVDPQLDLTRLFCSASAKTRAAKIDLHAAGWIVQNLPPGAERETRLRRLTRPTNSVEDDAVLQRNEASCRGASVLFLLLERVLLLVLVMLLNERHCVGDQHERREDDNDHIRSPPFRRVRCPEGTRHR
jgi:hypothetical protein